MVHNYRCDVKKALSKEEMAKVRFFFSNYRVLKFLIHSYIEGSRETVATFLHK